MNAYGTGQKIGAAGIADVLILISIMTATPEGM